MTTKKKKVLFILAGFTVALVFAACIFVFVFDINSYRPGIEAAASEATGLDVRINGKMGLSLFPLGISAKDIHIFNGTVEILSLENLKLGVELMPLLRKRLEVTRCELVKPEATIVRDAEGRFNFERAERKSKKEGAGAPLSLNDLKLSKGALVYLDKKTGEKIEIKDFNLAIKDLSIPDISGDIAKNASLSGSIDCKEVLQRDLRIENLKGDVKAVRGIYNIEPLTIGTLVYSGRKAGDKTELKKIKLDVSGLSIFETSGRTMKKVSFTGNLQCGEARRKDLKIEHVNGPLKAEKGVIYFRPFTMEIFGAKAEGDAAADKSEVNAVYKINLKISKLDFDKLQESFGKKKMIGGKGDLVASLTMREKEGHDLIRGMTGTFSLRGDNLVITSMDLDKVLSSYETSQQFDLVDMGAFFVAGPLSTVAVKGYRYGDLYSQTRGGRSTITKFVSHWQIRNGMADATDCALATQHNRVALKGKLNLVSERYDNVIVALLDTKGCAKFKQSISGPFGSPQVGAVSAIESLAGPISSLYKKVKRFVEGGKCEVFYNGSVRHPN
jgi:uncharacterized protein involved in outer membrane biogenesis